MKNLISTCSKTLILLTFLTSLTYAEIIHLSSGSSQKHLPASAESYYGDSEDGTLVCWLDENNNGSVIVQKIDNKGKIVWEKNGVMADNNLGYAFSADSDYPGIYSDGMGGAVIIYRKVFTHSEEIYFTKIFSDGSCSGRPICLSSGYEGYNFSPVSCKSNDDCIIVSWENFYDGDFSIHAQKIDLTGNKLWNKGREIIVCNESHDQRKPAILCTNNFVYFSWLDTRISDIGTEFSYSLFANKIDPDGFYTDFTDKGKLIFQNFHTDNTGHNQTKKITLYNHNMIESDNNSFIVALEKQVLDLESSVKIIKVSVNLNIEWDYDLDNSSFQTSPLIAPDENSGACVFWNEKLIDEYKVCGIRLSAQGSVITGGQNGAKISFDNSKDNLKRTIPLAILKNGILQKDNLLHVPWTAGDNGQLYLASIDLANTSVFKSTPELIYENCSGGEFVSVNDNYFDNVVVFKSSGNIYASVNTKLNNRIETENNNLAAFNFPNPFNPSTKINYELRIKNYEFVSLKIFNALGREIETLINQKQNAGRYEVEFNGSNLPSGIYYYRIEAGEFTAVRKMMLVK